MFIKTISNYMNIITGNFAIDVYDYASKQQLI